MEFYEEALSLVFDLTTKKISPDLWKVLEMIYQVTCSFSSQGSREYSRENEVLKGVGVAKQRPE